MKTETAACLVFITAVVSCARAQTLSPELAPLAAKYKADIAALEAQRTTAIAQAQKPYEAAMATAEKTATAAGNVAAVGVINTERVAMSKGLMPPGFPPGMPKELQAPRKVYLEAIERIRTAEAPRRQGLDGAYLRALTSLGTKASKESELAKQIDTEKQKLIANAPSAPSKQTGKNMVINGTFDAVEGGRPAGWQFIEPDAFKMSRDGTNNILHASAKVIGYAGAWQDILLPARSRTVTLSGRVRGQVLARKPGEPDFGGKILGTFLDKNETDSKNYMFYPADISPRWKTFSMTQKIPDDMKALRVTLEMKFSTGEFDFDDITVEFR